MTTVKITLAPMEIEELLDVVEGARVEIDDDVRTSP